MGRRSKSTKRCERCQLHEADCLCAHLPHIELATRLALVMHHRERRKTTATGPLALAALPNSALFLHGVRGAPLNLTPLHEPARRPLLLFPSEQARTLSRAVIEEDPRPITLIVPDGTWRQARRMPKRIVGLERVPQVKLPPGPPSRWGVRHEPMAAGLATLEAIARAFGIIESADVQRKLEAVFERATQATLRSRGRDPRPVDDAPAPSPAPLSIVYRDEHLVAINKPSGLAVHRGWAHDEVVAVSRLQSQLGRQVFPLHRLDRATSGVLLFALSSEVARDMQLLFQRDAMHKRYLALCRGRDASLRRVEAALAKEPGAPRRAAQTDFRLLGRFERYGLYEARPHTGRTHQIRRHLKHASHPIIGDVRYGKGEHNRVFRERFGFHRLALHCCSMAFKHPRSASELRIAAPLPADFATLLERLQLCHTEL